ncbi:MAG: hypothetical protein CME62_14375 [Halobacteriovoraceae bacterium]|nr:hypothetical protein [Halobacteriovoraceae bacterium]|tara:strand:+ start:3224 stop:4210 length:987 start_codon:yes stop_codon:yes gene_type:complete
MIKRVLINCTKIAFALGLVLWLVNSGKIDMELVYKSFQNPLNVIFILAFMLFDQFIVAIRWKHILESKAKSSLNLLNVFKANWIGIFFNSVLPGSVTGDLIKIFYIEQKNEKLSKKFLLGSVLLDRVIGLCGLILVGGLSCIIYYNFLAAQSEELKSLVHVNFLLSLAVIIAFIFLYNFNSIPLQLSSFVKKRMTFLTSLLEKLEVVWRDLVSLKGRLLKVLFLSMIVQAVAILIFWYVIHGLIGDEFQLYHAFSILPVGMISMAIPIAPAGLGVGHVVFLNLFSYIGISNGANLFNVYFIYVILMNLSGIFPYILHQGENKPLISRK